MFYNTGTVIPTRRTNSVNRNISDYISCSACFGLYSKLSIRKHFRKCNKASLPGKRNILILGRTVETDISPKASHILKTQIFPVLREDNYTMPLRYDELLIKFANQLCIKYPKAHNYPMIRNKIRLVGKIMHEMKVIDNTIQLFSDIFAPRQYDNVIKAIQIVAGLHSSGQHFKAPSTASAAGTLLKKSAKFYITELIKNCDDGAKIESVKNFINLLEIDFGITVSKTVTETQLKNKRLKKVVLPTKSDIRLLNLFLNEKRKKHYNSLTKGFNLFVYKELQKFTLTSLQVFNRRRAGEVQRIELNDFKNLQTLEDQQEQDIFIPENSVHQKKQYARFTIRGKLGREVPVLVYKELTECIRLLNNYRGEAGLTENPYIFGIPGTKGKCLDACLLMREFSVACGAKKPDTLRGTMLRKQVATQSLMFNLSETEVEDLANFMGHQKEIHKEHYRIPIATREITRMSKLLEMAQGGEYFQTYLR